MKKVLIALDYGPNAQKVAEAGYLLGKSLGAGIVILHVIGDSTYYPVFDYHPIKNMMGFTDTETEHLFDEGPRRAMELFLAKTKQFLNDESVQTLLKEGDFAETILSVARELNAGLIVIGSHCPVWSKNIVVGNITERVLQYSPVPLYAVPGKNHV